MQLENRWPQCALHGFLEMFANVVAIEVMLWFSHIFCDSIIANIKPKYCEFFLDSLSWPNRVFSLHSLDKFYKFPIYIRPANSSRFPFPVKMKSFFVPNDNGRGVAIISDYLQLPKILDSQTPKIRSAFLCCVAEQLIVGEEQGFQKLCLVYSWIWAFKTQRWIWQGFSKLLPSKYSYKTNP